jgi:hypothetical protein
MEATHPLNPIQTRGVVLSRWRQMSTNISSKT